MIDVIARLLWPARKGESGQTLIFVAVLGALLMGIMGLAVEGGRVFVEYRQMQSAADMAAIVGAQALPCGTTDASCIQTAEQQACDYAAKNGYGGCSPGAAGARWASVPPASCSPYDFIDYGNGSTNSNCKSASAPPFYGYLEVRLNKSLGTVPIFNVPVTLSTHAVAKHGVGLPGDYALVQLDPNGTMSSTSLALNGSAFSNAPMSVSGSACGGGFFSAGSVSGSISTNNTGTPGYSPVGCTAGSADSPPVTASNQRQVSDPYTGSQPPGTVDTSGNPTNNANAIPGCGECSQTGWWWNLDSGGWNQGTPGKHINAELFPGVYGALPNGGGQRYNWYFNPGVYTFTGGFGNTTINMCVYGAPVCDDAFGAGSAACATSTFVPSSAAANQFYYKCSAYGQWDKAKACAGGSPVPCSPPYWYDKNTGSQTTTPLNGVTIYFPPNAGGIQGRGNSGQNWLAAPNPCPGTGSPWSTGSVPFPQGSSSAVYTYLGGQPGNTPPAGAQTDPGQVYPSMDLSLLGECDLSTHLEVWPGEMVKPQHLHFMFYMYDGNPPTANSNSSFVRGGFDLHTVGIVYSPTSTWTERGNSNTDPVPTIAGQLIVGSYDAGGASSMSISYRPCGPGSTPCGSGVGSQLIQ